MAARPRRPERDQQQQPAAGHAHAGQPARIDMMAGEQLLRRDASERPQRSRRRGQAQADDAFGNGAGGQLFAQNPPAM
jgi:hypothetical protein